MLLVKDKNNSIKLSDNKYFDYSKSEIEVFLSGYSPDVIIKNYDSNEKWLIELAVTSFVGIEKLEKIKKDNLNCLEIDLKKIDRKINPSELKELIINNLEIRTILNQEKPETEKEKNDDNYLMLSLIHI